MGELDYGDVDTSEGRGGRGDYSSFGSRDRAPQNNGRGGGRGGGGRGKAAASRGRGSGGRGGGRGGGGRGGRDKETPASADALDADMDSYFSKKVRH
jgi:hypothetical protein